MELIGWLVRADIVWEVRKYEKDQNIWVGNPQLLDFKTTSKFLEEILFYC